jgi:hypothetical protein
LSDNDEVVRRTLSRDLFIIMVPHNWTPPHDLLDITGNFSIHQVSQLETQPKPMYPTAPYYRQMWKWREACNPISMEQMVNQRPHTNTVCYRGWHQSCIPSKYLSDAEHGNTVLGCSPLGDTWTTRTMKVLRLEDEVF